MSNLTQATVDAIKARAEANFKRRELQAQDGAKAWAEYQAERVSLTEKTKRLRALRLAKEAAEVGNVKQDRRSTKRRSSASAKH